MLLILLHEKAFFTYYSYAAVFGNNAIITARNKRFCGGFNKAVTLNMIYAVTGALFERYAL